MSLFVFTMPRTRLAAVVFPPDSNLRSALNTDVLTSVSGPLGHHVLADVSGHVKCVVEGHYDL